MAFLCPARAARKVKKRDDRQPMEAPPPGRITGSDSIDTLVQVDQERPHVDDPERKMVVLRDFSPCTADELAVTRGQQVRYLYQDKNNWSYVVTESGAEGFIPTSYCAPVGSSMDDLQFGRITTVRRNKNYNSIRSAPAMPYTQRKAASVNGPLASTGLAKYQPPKVVDGPDLIQHVRRQTAMALTPDERRSRKIQRHHHSMEDVLAPSHHDASPGARSLPQQRSACHQFRVSGLRTPDNKGFDSSSSHSPNQTYATVDYARNIRDSSSRSGGVNNKVGQQNEFASPRHNTQHISGKTKDAIPKLFLKAPKGRYIVLYRYGALNENDLTVSRGEFVTLLNRDDPDWLWVMNDNRQEGFVPSSYVMPAQGNNIDSTDRMMKNLKISPIKSPPYQHTHHHPHHEHHSHLSHQSPLRQTHPVQTQSHQSQYYEHDTTTHDRSSHSDHSSHKGSQIQTPEGNKEYRNNLHSSNQLVDSKHTYGEMGAVRRSRSETDDLSHFHRHRNSSLQHNSKQRQDAMYLSSDHVRRRDLSLSPSVVRRPRSQHDLSQNQDYISTHNGGRFSQGPADFHQPNSSGQYYHSTPAPERNVSHSSKQYASSSPPYSGHFPRGSLDNLNASAASAANSGATFSPNVANIRAEPVTFQDRNTSHRPADQTSSTRPSHSQRDPHEGWSKQVVVRDYHATFQDAMSVSKGDLLLVDPRDPGTGPWMWCFSLRTSRHGYVPRAHASARYMTAL